MIQAKVSKIGTTEVEYIKWNNQNGPQYSIAIADILAINYQNGEKETFENVNNNATGQQNKDGNNDKQGVIEITPELLSAYAKAVNEKVKTKINAPVDLIFNNKEKKKIGVKEANTAIACFGVSQNSVLCDENIEISVITGQLYKSTYKMPGEWRKNALDTNLGIIGHAKAAVNPAIMFVIKNLSNKTLYIDLANTFFVNRGKTQSYYVPSSTTTSKTSSSGASVNLGAVTGALGIGGVAGTLANGINAGGGSSSTTSNTIYSQRVVALAPNSSLNLDAKFFFGDESETIMPGLIYQTYRSSGFQRCGFVNFTPVSEKNKVMCGERFTYSEKSSPIHFSFYLNY